MSAALTFIQTNLDWTTPKSWQQLKFTETELKNDYSVENYELKQRNEALVL